ncbi:MAG: KilA-N domain-containing protein [Eubacterium sp.]|nr:KilA-N domain-containing protein [Eubacterium sp.]
MGIYTANFENEFISLTDIAKYRNEDDFRFVIQNWMRNRNTIEFLGVWEELHNSDFNRVQFETVKLDYGKDCTIRILTPSNSRGLNWVMRG